VLAVDGEFGLDMSAGHLIERLTASAVCLQVLPHCSWRELLKVLFNDKVEFT
jgi:hypothetical protein